MLVSMINWVEGDIKGMSKFVYLKVINNNIFLNKKTPYKGAFLFIK